MKTAVAIGVIAALCACKGAKEQTEPEAPVSAPEAAAAQPLPTPSAPNAAQSYKSLVTVSEEKLTRYLAYRKELLGEVQRIVGESRAAPPESGRAAGGPPPGAAISQRIGQAAETLLSKHGLSQAEGTRYQELVEALTTASVSMNPSLAEAAQALRKQAEGTGPGMEKAREAARQALKQMDENEKRAREQFTQKFGTDALELLSKHNDELRAITVEGMRAAMGAGR